MSPFGNVSLRWSLALIAGAIAATITGCQSMLEESAEVADVEDDLALEPEAIPLLAGQSTLAFTSPSGLIASTGNLYWTSTQIEKSGPAGSTVWRASKSSVPGNEVALYGEVGDDTRFGAIVYANPGTYYGYFVANYAGAGGFTSQIKRVPLDGGPAVVIATSPAPIQNRDLVTDQTKLFWVDAGGIRSVPLAGGTVTTVRASSVITRLRVEGAYLYYGEEFLIFRKPKAGGPEGVMVSTSGRVTALHVDAAGGRLYWGEDGGGVRSTTLAPGGPQVTYQGSIAGRVVTSVGWDGTRVLWTDCVQPAVSCRVIKKQGVITQILSSGGIGVGHLQWDAASLYWGDAGLLRKFVY